MCDKPTWVIGLAQNGQGETRDYHLSGWTNLRLIQTASRKYPGEQRGPKLNVKWNSGTE